MQATKVYRTALSGLALLMALTTCQDEGDAPTLPDPNASPDEPEPLAANVLVEVVDRSGDAVIGAKVAMATDDGDFWIHATDGRGRTWFEVHPDDVQAVVAARSGWTFAAMDGDLLEDRVIAYEPITLTLERRERIGKWVSVTGELQNLKPVTSSVVLSTTVADADFTTLASQGRFHARLPADQPFTLIGLQWRRPESPPPRGILREFVAWAHADSGWPLEDALTIDLDFGPEPAFAPSDPPQAFAWTRHDVRGSLAAPSDPTLRDGGIADLSVHFIGSQGEDYLGGATYTAPSEEGFNYAASWFAPIGSAVQTLVTVRGGGGMSGAWLTGPPSVGTLDVELFSPPDVVTDGDDAHGVVRWTASPDEGHDLTVLHVLRDGELLGQLFAPAYLRSASLPVMPTWEAETELIGPLQLIVELCATDPIRNRCERFARTGPLSLAPAKIFPPAG
jgi:hypothetical protein